MEQLQERLRQHRPEDLALKKEFLAFQARHFNLKWSDLLEIFAKKEVRGSLKQERLTQAYFDQYLAIEGYPAGMDLSSYVTAYGQRGLAQMTSLNDFEKNAVIDLAKYQLAYHYQLIDELGNYRGINLDRILQQTEYMNLINIAKVANNLSHRIQNDYQLYILQNDLSVEIEELPANDLTYLETSPNGVDFYQGESGLEVRVAGQRVVFLAAGDDSSGIIREPAYQPLDFLMKYDIIQRLSQYISEQERKEPEQLKETAQVSAQDFTAVLDAAYNFGQPRHQGNTPPKEFEGAWNLFYKLFDRLETLDAVVAEAKDKDLLDTDSDFYHDYLVDKDIENQQAELLTFQSATIEWSEISSETNLTFTSLQDLQAYLTQHFVRTKADYDDFIANGGEYHFYDKVKLHLDFGNRSGASHRLSERLDMGFGNSDFNPYLQTVSNYLLLGRLTYFEHHQLDMESFELSLPTHTFSSEVVQLLQGEDKATHFETIFEAYQYGCRYQSFKENFPTIEAYVAYYSQPYELLVTEAPEKTELERLEEQFPIGSLVLHKGDEFRIKDVSESYGNYRIELTTEMLGNYITMNPILYGSFEELQREIQLVETRVEVTPEPVADSPQPQHIEIVTSSKETRDDKTLTDFSFPADTANFYPRTPTEKVTANIAAVRLVKQLEKENKQATPEEQEILAKYVGWGGLANDFFNEYNQRFEGQRAELKAMVSEEEYAAMRESSLTAYYTDPEIIREMWQKLINDGFTGGRILDPSMGTGNFFAAMPKEIRDKSKLYGVELDGVTGAIARQLHPNATIQIKGFEETNFNDGAFDLVMSNIPFANVRIADMRYEKPYVIHDYFVKRSMDLLRHGGVLSVISSTGTMDKRTGNVLKDIEGTTDFLGGVRLPDTAFKRIAGTRVTTDILYFQKNEEKKLRLATTKENHLAFKGSEQLASDQRVWLNPYFNQEENKQVLGDYEVRNFNGGTLSVKATSDYFIENLKGALTTILPARLLPSSHLPTVETDKSIVQDIPEGLAMDMPVYSFAYVGDTIYYRDSTTIRVGTRVEDISFYVDEMGLFKAWADNPSKRLIEQFQALKITDETALDVYQSEEPTQRGKNKGYYKKTIFFETPLTDKEISRIKGMVDIRDTYQALIALQRYHNYDLFAFEQLLIQLNDQYDSFVKKHGYLNSTANRYLFDSDDRYSLLASLEDEVIDDITKKVGYQKSLAFERALIRPERVLKEVATAKDALNASVAEGRGVDFTFMMGLYKGKTELDLIDELGDEIIPNPKAYRNPSQINPFAYLPRNQFLSGDVVTRIEEVESLIEAGETSHNWERYREMLLAVRPERITLTDIDYKIGSRWIPDKVYSYFASQTFANHSIEQFDDVALDKILKTNPIDHKMAYISYGLGMSSATDFQLGVRNSRHDLGRKIFLNLINSNQATITKKVNEDGKERTITDVEKTAELRAKEAEIQELFKEFVEKSPEIQTVMEETYNNLYNRVVTREYDGSHLEIDGLASNIELRPHQKNAIQRIVEEKRALLAHEVGSGKTLTMLGAGFKLKELGMVQKPLYVVPSSLTAQFGQEIMKFFPTKNVFVTTKKDFIKSNRKQFISRIITGDYDAIVMGDSQFEKIPMSKENQELYLRDKLDELREMKENSSDNMTVKQIEAAIKSFKEQLEKLQDLSQDSFIEFENLGIDCLFVDEAHHFKNIRPVTNLGNVAGITNKTSKKNIDMEMKVRQIQSENDDLGIIFATGTPVSNSISEIFTMMNYVQPDVLKRYQVEHFDAWVGAFGQIENTMELSPTGDKYQPKKRFKKFTNLPELMKIYKETTDIQTSDMLDLPVPQATVIPVESDLTDSQRDYLADLVTRSDEVKAGLVDPTQDNMLRITSEARKLAIDMRLLDDSYDLSDNNKLLQVVDNVERIYYEGDDQQVTQMIFSDIGTPKSNTNQGTFDVYNELRNLLIERGIPAQEIAFVHDANTDEKKNTLSRKVNSGEVRILLASTEKGGTGLNVQRKMKAVHHLDVPWRPSDLTQRNGRLIRQGNENKEVEIYHYITKGSFDNFLWETQEKKLKYITQIMTSKEPVRAAEDIDEQTMTASDFKALATGNPYLRKKMELENKLNLLENQRRAFYRNRDSARDTLTQIEQKLPSLQQRLPRIEEDRKKADVTKEVDFSIVLADQSFDKKEEAGLRLHELITTNVSETAELRTLGTYRGFELKALTQERQAAIYEFGDLLIKPTYALQVVGLNQYPVNLDLESAIGTIRRIDNVINNIEKDKEKTQSLIHSYETQAAAAKETLSKTFPMVEYQETKEQYNLLAPLIEAGESVETIEIAIRSYLDNRPQPLDRNVSKTVDL